MISLYLIKQLIEVIKMKKITYKELKKIIKPVVLLCDSNTTGHWRDRIRILYPDGRCEYNDGLGLEIGYKSSSKFKLSCFTSNSLNKTINNMEKYDYYLDYHKLYILEF